MRSEDPRERADLCGRQLMPELPGKDWAEEYDPSTWYKAEDGTDYCCREVWDGADTDRCIWHADTEDKPADELAAARSGEPERLDLAVLRDSDLRDSVSFSECLLVGANLRGATLGRADLSGAGLFGAHLGEAVLWEADLSGTDLRGADLTACTLDQTTFEDARFDEATTFGAMSGYEFEADEAAEAASWLASHVSPRLRAFGRPSTDPRPLERAATQYRTVQRLRREHDLKQDPALEIQEHHARRKRALAERRYWDWFKLAIYRWPMGYGEKPWHVVGTSLAVILVSALLYPLAGIRVDGAERTYPAVLADPAGTAGETVRVIAESVYFSTVTFTTLGYGDVEPVG